jgi:CheY-like chemotaxis protein
LKAQNELDLLPGDYAHISLIDTGEGMSSHVMQRAFEPFFTTRGLHEGTGIGLSQVYGFCKQARGMVALQSVVGKGTTVGMYLPIVMVPPVRPSSGDNMTRTVLVVEDNTELLEVVEEILSDVGWTVFTATNGTKGLLALKERGAQITLLLTDVVMPDVSGIELASRARDTYPHIKVLLMTGFADVQTGVLPLVRKPFRRKELIEAISRVMADTGIGRWTNA